MSNIISGEIKLHKAQAEIFNSNSRFKVVAAGRRFGKSILAMSVLVYEASRKNNQLVWYVAPTYGMAKQIMWDELNKFLPIKWIKRKNETSLRFELVNGSVIVLKGADNPDNLRGVGLDYVVLDEVQDMKDDVWKTVLRPTLATTNGGALFIGTSKSYNHFYDLWQNGNNDSTGVWESWQFMTKDSPFVPKAEIEQAKKDMDANSFSQEYEASFISMSGRVYYGFDRKKNIKEGIDFNPQLPIYIGQDFNIDPMSSCIMQIQDNGEVWVIDEIVLFGSNTAEVCDEIERRYWRHKKQITIYPDPAGGSRQHARGETDLDIFREKGFRKIKYRKKHPFVADRINCVNKLILSASGEIKLFVNKKCKHTINAFEQTIYKDGTREVDKTMGVEHISDGCGYFCELEFPTRRVEVVGISI